MSISEDLQFPHQMHKCDWQVQHHVHACKAPMEELYDQLR